MKRDKKEEGEFLNDLNDLLAGRQVDTGGRSEDERSALDFAKKYTECRGEPTAEFHNSLKRRLLLRLTEQEVKAQERREQRWGWLSGFTAQSPARRAAIGTVIAVVVTIGVLWARGTFSPATGPVVVSPTPELEPPIVTAPPPPVTAPVFRATATPDKSTYATGEDITIKFSLSNISQETVTIESHPPQIEIRNAEDDQTVSRFAAGTDKQELAPSQTLEYTFVWDQLDGRGHPIPPGSYTVSIEVSSTSTSQPNEVSVNLENLAEFTVQSP